LKDPPKGYQEPAVDLRARFYNTFNDAHDGHFRLAPDLLSKVVGFRRPVQLVSVSRDGVEIPKIYIRGEKLPKALLHQIIDIFARGHCESE
jgi:hypothetical protein